METGYAVLTVLFEDPFWVGIYERREGRAYQVCKITFGAEPRDYEVYALLLEHWRHLPFSPSMEGAAPEERRINPKRMQRQIQKSLQNTGIGTKAQQALQLQREQGKEARRKASQEEREAEADRQFALRREKQREKHKGHCPVPQSNTLRGFPAFRACPW